MVRLAPSHFLIPTCFWILPIMGVYVLFPDEFIKAQFHDHPVKDEFWWRVLIFQTRMTGFALGLALFTIFVVALAAPIHVQKAILPGVAVTWAAIAAFFHLECLSQSMCREWFDIVVFANIGFAFFLFSGIFVADDGRKRVVAAAAAAPAPTAAAVKNDSKKK